MNRTTTVATRPTSAITRLTFELRIEKHCLRQTASQFQPSRIQRSTFNVRCSTFCKSSANEKLAARRHGNRRGAFTVVVLVCLLLSTMLLGSLLKIVLLQDRQMGREFVRVQAGWLAESALDRAARRLAADREFAGESWNIAADRLGGHDSAAVTIHVEKPEGQTLQRLIVVEALYPAQGPEQARVTRQATVTLLQEP